jgi:hypothetical protein
MQKRGLECVEAPIATSGRRPVKIVCQCVQREHTTFSRRSTVAHHEHDSQEAVHGCMRKNDALFNDHELPDLLDPVFKCAEDQIVFIIEGYAHRSPHPNWVNDVMSKTPIS